MKKIVLLYVLPLFILTGCFSNKHIHLKKGLAAYYPFNGNANDSSKNKNNPIFNNASLTVDRFGKANSACHFNGIDNYIEIPNSPSLNFTNKMSIAVWVKPMGFYNGTCHGNEIVMKGDADFLPGNYLLRFGDNFYNPENCSSNVDSEHENFYGPNTGGLDPFIKLNNWYLIVYTCDGDSGKLYVNSRLVARSQNPELKFTNDYDLYLGKLNAPLFPYWFNGDLDEVRIYNRAINAKEVKTLSEIQ